MPLTDRLKNIICSILTLKYFQGGEHGDSEYESADENINSPKHKKDKEKTTEKLEDKEVDKEKAEDTKETDDKEKIAEEGVISDDKSEKEDKSDAKEEDDDDDDLYPADKEWLITSNIF